MNTLVPTKWAPYAGAATGDLPIRWEGWIYLSPAIGLQWVVIDLFGATP